MVITFLPYPDIKRSIQSIDNRRLVKQMVEAYQIIRALRGETDGWRRHPATLMWEGYEEMLKVYYNECISQHVGRGGATKMAPMDVDTDKVRKPWWLGWKHLHFSHQASLIRKHPLYYKHIFTDLPSFYMDKGYVWPAKYNIMQMDRNDVFDKVNTKTISTNEKSVRQLYTNKELVEMCNERGIKGCARRKKDDLLKILGLL